MCSSNPFSYTLKRRLEFLFMRSFSFFPKKHENISHSSPSRIFGLYNFCTCSNFSFSWSDMAFVQLVFFGSLLERHFERHKKRESMNGRGFHGFWERKTRGWRNQFIVEKCIFEEKIKWRKFLRTFDSLWIDILRLWTCKNWKTNKITLWLVRKKCVFLYGSLFVTRCSSGLRVVRF